MLLDDGDTLASLGRVDARFDPGRLKYLASWITPVGVPRRFEARFYLAEVSADVEGAVVTDELAAMAWLEPSEILARVETGEWPMMFPTLWHVELVANSEDPFSLEPHPIRELKTAFEPFEIMDLGMPIEEVR